MSKLSSLICGVSLLFGGCVTHKTQQNTDLTSDQIATIFQSYKIEKHRTVRDKNNRQNLGIENGEAISDTVQIEVGGILYYLVRR